MFRIKISISFGLESVVKNELLLLGYKEVKVVNGAIYLNGNLHDIMRLNLSLRSADRVYIVLSENKIFDFDELFLVVNKIPWGEFLKKDSKIIVEAKRKSSSIKGIPSIQAISKKAIIESLKREYKINNFPETGKILKVVVNIEKDLCEVLLDTTGEGLHKRGYKKKSVKAPLRENISAGIVLLSKWRPEIPLWDPFCGSGTIPIEAYMIATGIPPGIFRNFSFENFRNFDEKTFDEIKHELTSKRKNFYPEIIASDISSKAIDMAKENFKNLCSHGKKSIKFFVKDFRKFTIKRENLVLITNLPYGKRISANLDSIYKALKNAKKNNPQWKFFILTSDLSFEEKFGFMARKKRKLYNGKIQVYLYQYY